MNRPQLVPPTISRKDKDLQRQAKVVNNLANDLKLAHDKLVRMNGGMTAAEAKADTKPVFFEGENVELKGGQFKVKRLTPGMVVLEEVGG